MFETSVVETRPGHGPLQLTRGFNLSIIAHVCAVAGWLILGIAWIDFPADPPDQWQAYSLELLVRTPPPAPPPPPPPRAVTASPEPVADFAPDRIPDAIPELEEQPRDTRAPEQMQHSAAGVTGGVEGGVMGGVIGGLLQGELNGRLGGVTGSVTTPRRAGDPVVVPRDASLPTPVKRRVHPIYPREAQLRALEGTVIVRYVIDRSGKVREVEVVRHARHRSFTASAIKAIRQWQFEPFIEDGEPVEIVHELTIYFELVRG